MRFLHFFFLLAGFGLSAQQAEPLLFNEKVHDFGTLNEDAGNAEFEFTFTNNSGLTLTIVSVKASCGCTTPGWTREPIPPGKTGFVKASYNPKGRPGFFSKTLTVATNLDGPPMVLTIKGNVTNDVAESDNNRLAYTLGNLKFRARTINFGKVYINKPAVTQDIPVFNSGDRTIVINEVKAPPYIKVQAPPSIEPGTRASVRLEYNAMLKNQYGFAGDNIEFVTDDDNTPQKAFTVYATIEEFFLPVAEEEKGKIPVMVIGEEAVDFGAISIGSTEKKEINIRNSGRKELSIRYVQPNCPCVLTNISTDKIKPGETATLSIAWKGDGRRGTQNKAVTIYSTDPVNPVQRISLSGQIN